MLWNRYSGVDWKYIRYCRIPNQIGADPAPGIDGGKRGPAQRVNGIWRKLHDVTVPSSLARTHPTPVSASTEYLVSLCAGAHPFVPPECVAEHA